MFYFPTKFKLTQCNEGGGKVRSTRYTCRNCHTQLGVIRHGRVLSLEPGVRVAAEVMARADEVKVICPLCRAGRTFRSGVVLVAISTAAMGSTE